MGATKQLTVLESEVEEVVVCPYCMEEYTNIYRGCCGEGISHAITVYEYRHQLYTEDEITIIREGK